MISSARAPSGRAASPSVRGRRGRATDRPRRCQQVSGATPLEHRSCASPAVGINVVLPAPSKLPDEAPRWRCSYRPRACVQRRWVWCVGDGVTKDTAAVEKAVAAVKEAGAGTVTLLRVDGSCSVQPDFTLHCVH